MSKNNSYSPLAIAVGAAFATSMMGSAVANATDNPFGMTELSHGYQVADAKGKGKEGTCGANKTSVDEAKSGKNMAEDTQAGMSMGSGNTEDGNGAMDSDGKKTPEGKCGGNK